MLSVFKKDPKLVEISVIQSANIPNDESMLKSFNNIMLDCS